MGKTTKTRARQSARTGSFEIFTYPQRSTPVRLVGLVWRWRIELVLIALLVIVWAWLSGHLPSWGVWLTELGTIAAVLAVPVSRRFVVCRCWCVISRHRVRKCFVQARVMTHEGQLPLFIWTRPTPVGERLRLWLRPGLSVRDVDTVTDRIAAACWARDARVEVHPNRVSTVWVHVIRRDPLAAAGQIPTPLLDAIPTDHSTQESGDLVPLPDRATVTAATPPATTGASAVTGSAAATRATAPKRTTTRSTPVADEVSAPAVLGWSGEDVSDYV